MHDTSDTQIHKNIHTHTQTNKHNHTYTHNILLTSMLRLLNYSKQLAKCVNLDMLVLLVYIISIYVSISKVLE